MTARLKPTGTILVRKPGGEFEELGTYTSLTVTVEDTIEGGEDPVEFEVRKVEQLVGPTEWRDPRPPRMEIALQRERDRLPAFFRGPQDPAAENRKQRRAREARERRSA